MNSERKKVQKNYIVKLPDDIIKALAEFLETKALINLAITDKKSKFLLKSQLNIPKKTYNNQLIGELRQLEIKISNTEIKGQINKIIGNIESTGELYNSFNYQILDQRKELLNSLFSLIKNFKNEYSHLIPFFTNFYIEYESYLPFLGLKYIEASYNSDAKIEGDTSTAKKSLFSLYHFLEKYKDYSKKMDIPFMRLKNDYAPIINFCFEELLKLTHPSFELNEAYFAQNNQHINACIRAFTVLMHHQHYFGGWRTETAFLKNKPGMTTNMWREGKNFWEIIELRKFEKAIDNLIIQQKKCLIELEELDNVKAELLAKLFAFYTVDSENLINFFYSLENSSIFNIFEKSGIHEDKSFTLKTQVVKKTQLIDTQKMSVKKLEILRRVEAGLLASLLKYHYEESGSITSFIFSLDKTSIRETIEKLIQIREGEISTMELESIKNCLITLCKKDDRLSSLLKQWDSSIYSFNFTKELKLTDKKKDYFASTLKEEKSRNKTALLEHSVLSQPTKYKVPEAKQGLLSRLGFEKAFVEDLKLIKAIFIESTHTSRVLQGVKLIEIYSMIDKTLKDIDQLTYISEVPIDQLWTLNKKISEAQILFSQQDVYDEEIQTWYNKLSQIKTYLNNVITSIIQNQPTKRI